MTGETIQIVEDESLIVLHLTQILESAGYRIVYPASSGERALRALEMSPVPDLILMDILLAGSLDGIETAREIRKHYDIPIIFLTACADISRIEEAKSVSPYGYISKPFLQKDILDAVEHALCR